VNEKIAFDKGNKIKEYILRVFKIKFIGEEKGRKRGCLKAKIGKFDHLIIVQ
jgi:hypothetical protein